MRKEKESNVNTPLVSVYIPTHNRSHLLEKAIASVLSQSYQNIELLIVNDGSTDDTESVVRAFCQQDSRVRYLQHSTPKGACVARNYAINMAKGEYVTGLDDDDEFMVNRIELLMKAMLRTSSSFVCSGYLWKSKINTKRLFCYQGKITLGNILDINSASNQILVETKKIKAVGAFDESLASFQDYDCWVRLIAAFGPAYRIEIPTYTVNVDDELPRISSNKVKRSEAFECFLLKHNALMNQRNKANQAFRRKVVNREKVNLIEVFLALRFGLFRKKIGYYLSQYRNGRL